MIFKVSTNFVSFFKILPEDWQQSIVPFWKNYKSTTKCYLIKENNHIIAGGLVLSKCPPDMLYAKNEAETWLNNGYLYLAFIYVIEERRQQNLGSVWLDNLKNHDPKQKFWLTIEDLNLHAFYVKNGFKRIKSLNNNGAEEVVYTYVP